MNSQICFFIGAAIKTAVLVSWHTTPVCLCKSDDLQLEIRKRSCRLKNIALNIALLVLKLCPTQVVISLPLWIKLTLGQLLLFFLSNFSSFFSYIGGIPIPNHSHCLLIERWIYFGYAANYNTKGAFAILSSVCSDLLNFLKGLGTIVITTKSD